MLLSPIRCCIHKISTKGASWNMAALCMAAGRKVGLAEDDSVLLDRDRLERSRQDLHMNNAPESRLLARALERNLRDSGMLDMEALCVAAGRKVWI